MSYWKDRMALAQSNITAKSTLAVEKQLKRYYADTMKRTISDFENTYLKLLKTVEDGKEPTPADLYKLDKYWQMQAQARVELEALGAKQIALFSKEFELNWFEVYHSINIEGAVAYNTLDKAAVKQMLEQVWCADGKSWSARVWGNTNELLETLNNELIHIVAAGKKPTDLKNALQERFNVSYSKADRIVRTELAHIQTQAAQQRYKDYGLQWGEVWADKDERRCDVCGELHRKRFLLNTAAPVPAHSNCRCCILPVVDTDDEQLKFDSFY